IAPNNQQLALRTIRDVRAYDLGTVPSSNRIASAISCDCVHDRAPRGTLKGTRDGRAGSKPRGQAALGGDAGLHLSPAPAGCRPVQKTGETMTSPVDPFVVRKLADCIEL